MKFRTPTPRGTLFNRVTKLIKRENRNLEENNLLILHVGAMNAAHRRCESIDDEVKDLVSMLEEASNSRAAKILLCPIPSFFPPRAAVEGDMVTQGAVEAYRSKAGLMNGFYNLALEKGYGDRIQLLEAMEEVNRNEDNYSLNTLEFNDRGLKAIHRTLRQAINGWKQEVEAQLALRDRNPSLEVASSDQRDTVEEEQARDHAASEIESSRATPVNQ